MITKKLNTIFIILFGTGNFILILSRKISYKINDFELGFLEGLAVTIIVCATGYLCWSFLSKSRHLE